MVDINKKLPPDPVSEKEIIWKYGTTMGWRGKLGECEFTYANPDEPDKYSKVSMDATGSFNFVWTDAKEKENRTNLRVGNEFSYYSDSTSIQTDGHSDTGVESTKKINIEGDYGTSCRTRYDGSTKGLIEAIGDIDTKFVCTTSESWSAHGTDGDHVEEHSGNWHQAFEKDRVTAVKNNEITMVEDGDYALHVQSGNWDTHIAEKARLYADNDILIESATKIVLKVGTSTITITPSNIEILADGGSGRIDLNN